MSSSSVFSDNLAWDTAGHNLFISYATGLGLFFISIFIILFKQWNEIVIARRTLAYGRALYLGLLLAAILQLIWDVKLSIRTSWPLFTVTRPLWSMLFAGLGFFVDSHCVFRWLQLGVQPVILCFESFAVAELLYQLSCRTAGTCVISSGWSVLELQLLIFRHYLAIVLGICVILVVGYLTIVLGACRARYPVRLFSSSQPLSTLPENRTVYGRTEMAAFPVR